MDVLVVGAGTMGRWVAAVGVEAGWSVALADRDPGVARAAAESVGAERVPLSGDRRFDAVCLAVPMSVVGDSIREHAARAERALFDVSGVMAEPLEVMERVAPDRERVSLHPLFAPANEPGNVASVVASRGAVTESLHAVLRERGNTVFETTAEEHDRAMGTVQAAAHTAVLAYALASETVREEFHTPLSGPLEELVEQLTNNSPGVYGEIQQAFPGAETVADAAARIAAADPEAFAELYAEAGAREGKQ